MKVLDIYENTPKTYNKNNTSLIWNDKIEKRSAKFFSIYDLINNNSNLNKIALNNHLKKFVIQNQKTFFSSFNLKKESKGLIKGFFKNINIMKSINSFNNFF